MLYCALDDASNNSLKNKLDQYDKINNVNKTINYDKTHDFDNYNDIHINNDNNVHYPSFFTAQGDYENRNNGTTINQLKNVNNNDDINNNYTNNQSLLDSLSFDDSIMSDEPSISPQKKKKPLSHDYCINIITKELLNNGDASLMSSHNGLVYKHVKTCKICKNKIKSIMKEHYCKPDYNINNINNNKINNIEHFEDTTNIIGYDIKELVLIILGGIILIFVFDLLVRMGSKIH